MSNVSITIFIYFFTFFCFFACAFQILVLLDMTESQSMLNEGIAREVINRIQRLRKKVCVVVIYRLSVISYIVSIH